MTPSLEIGNGNWAVKSDSLLGYKTINGKYYPREMSVTRATTATRVNAAGLVELVPYNLLEYSEQFENSYWVKDSGVSINSNASIAPNGTNTADRLNLSTGGAVYRSGLVLGTGSFTLSVWLKGEGSNIGKQVLLEFTNGNSTVTLTGDWQRFTTVGSNASFAAIKRNTVGQADSVLAWGIQLVEGTQALNYLPTTDRLDIARVDYSLGQANLLLEPQRTNLAVNSVWSGGGVSPTSWNLNAGSTGTTTPTTSIKTSLATAYRFQVNNQRRYLIQPTPITSGVTYSFSIYVESVVDSMQIQNMLNCFAIGSQVFTRNGVTISPADEVQAGFRYTLTGIASSTATVEFRVGGGVGGADIADVTLSMPQIEVGSFPTSFIPSTSTSVTRNADVISRSNIFTNGYITSAGGTWFVEFRNNAEYIKDSGDRGLFLDTSSTGNTNGFQFVHRNTVGITQRILINKRISGSDTIIYQSSVPLIKIAIKWNGATADVFANGTKVVNATAFTTTAMEFLNFITDGVPFNIKSMSLYPTPLSDTELINLTTL